MVSSASSCFLLLLSFQRSYCSLLSQYPPWPTSPSQPFRQELTDSSLQQVIIPKFPLWLRSHFMHKAISWSSSKCCQRSLVFLSRAWMGWQGPRVLPISRTSTTISLLPSSHACLCWSSSSPACHLPAPGFPFSSAFMHGQFQRVFSLYLRFL